MRAPSLPETVSAPSPVRAQPWQAEPNGLSTAVTGARPAATFSGTFTILRFTADEGVVAAVGVVSGTVGSAAGPVATIMKTITVPVALGETSCEILRLEIGPVSVEVLELHVDLNRIALHIDAPSGPAHPLRSLLCTVAGRVEKPDGLAEVLNEILELLV
jgi:hypothetical protein